MASVSSGRGARGPIIGINVTPMVDVVLVLLVIMMVSAMYIASQMLKVELPKTATSDDQVPTVATVTLTKERTLLYNQEPVDEPELIAKLHAAHVANENINLVISADTEVNHGTVVHVIDLAKIEGITKFAINVERSK
jgi:biopolymer transport protein ExbD